MDIFKLKTVQLCAVTARPLSFILLFYLNLTYLTFLSHFSIHSHSSGHLLHLHLEFSFWFLIRALHLWPNILILSSCLTAFLLNFFFFFVSRVCPSTCHSLWCSFSPDIIFSSLVPSSPHPYCPNKKTFKGLHLQDKHSAVSQRMNCFWQIAGGTASS